MNEMLKIYAKYALLAAIPAFAQAVSGVGPVQNVDAAKAAAIAVAVGVGTAVARALYGAIRRGELPFPNFGR